MMRLLTVCCLLAATLVSAPALTPAVAQDTRYNNPSWGPPGGTAGGNATQQGMIDELKTLIDEAEKARAADRRFLTDLKDLIARYERPWTQRILFDDFADGDITAAPAWTVPSGRFWVERGYGLRSVAEAGAAAAPEKLSDKELAAKVIGNLLGQALGGKGEVTTTTTSPTPQPAEARLAGTIPPAFAVTARLTSWKREGRYEIGVFQNTDGTGGYRVVYTPGTTSTWELVKVSARGRAVISSRSGGPALEDEKTHVLDWTRTSDGTQALHVDGEEVLRERDTSFRDSFVGLTLVNAGADIILRDVEVLGATP